MRGQLLIVLLLPFTIIQAGTIATDCEANRFVVTMAGQRALEELAFKTRSSIAEDNLVIQTDLQALAVADVSRYTAEAATSEVRGRIVVTITAGGRDRSTFDLTVTLEKLGADGSWQEIESNGALEEELNESIKFHIERYRKAASLN